MAMFAMGCFWGPEKLFWDQPGVWVTAVGYSGGYTANPTYDDMKRGATGHAEVVRIVFDPAIISYESLLKLFWERHDPTSGMRQGVDVGTQYRSVIFYLDDAQRELALRTKDNYQEVLTENGYGPITTEIEEAGVFYFAEGYHQAYFAKNPTGYCVNGTGVPCPIGAR
ncbi:MAG TPA: peptide-methionine (S)-S-oxide reductase MsrA [Allosphingosinicella sp.]